MSSLLPSLAGLLALTASFVVAAEPTYPSIGWRGDGHSGVMPPDCKPVTCIFTTWGQLIRFSDGKLLLDKDAWFGGNGSILADGRIYGQVDNGDGESMRKKGAINLTRNAFMFAPLTTCTALASEKDGTHQS